MGYFYLYFWRKKKKISHILEIFKNPNQYLNTTLFKHFWKEPPNFSEYKV